jgi:hypothetical protein
MDNKLTSPNNPLNDQPLFDETTVRSDNPAADLIRQKLTTIFEDEPSAKQEVAEVSTASTLSKHQRFIQELSRTWLLFRQRGISTTSG